MPLTGGAVGTTIPSSTSPTVDSNTPIAVDTDTDNNNITQGSVVFYDGTGTRYVISVDTLPSTNGHVLTYNGTTKKYEFSAAPGAAGGDAWGDVVDADIIPSADGTWDLGNTTTRFAEAYTDALFVTNNITVGGTVDGRDLAADGTKLDGIEALADVTDSANVVSSLSGATLTGNLTFGAAVYDAGGATSFEIPNGAAPTVNAAGEIAVDTSITDYTGMIKYHDGVEELTVLALPTANLATINGHVVAYNATNNELEMVAQSGGGGSMPTKEFVFDAANLQMVEDNSAPLAELAGTNVDVLVRAFDDTTEEYANGKIHIPGDVDTSGTVTFRAYVMAATAAASRNIALTLGHLALNNSEAHDAAYTDEDSGDVSIDATQGDVTEVTWTETITNLSWAANDLVLFRISRPSASVNDLVGDMYLFSLSIEIPRA